MIRSTCLAIAAVAALATQAQAQDFQTHYNALCDAEKAVGGDGLSVSVMNLDRAAEQLCSFGQALATVSQVIPPAGLAQSQTPVRSPCCATCFCILINEDWYSIEAADVLGGIALDQAIGLLQPLAEEPLAPMPEAHSLPPADPGGFDGGGFGGGIGP